MPASCVSLHPASPIPELLALHQGPHAANRAGLGHGSRAVRDAASRGLGGGVARCRRRTGRREKRRHSPVALPATGMHARRRTFLHTCQYTGRTQGPARRRVPSYGTATCTDVCVCTCGQPCARDAPCTVASNRDREVSCQRAHFSHQSIFSSAWKSRGSRRTGVPTL